MQLIRIIKTAEYRKISGNSKKIHASTFLILYNTLDTRGDPLRVGITVSKRVGGAVLRNKCKRLIRAVLREIIPSLTVSSMELIIIAKRNMLKASYYEIKEEMISILDKASR